jgi:hypothetical protein
VKRRDTVIEFSERLQRILALATDVDKRYAVIDLVKSVVQTDSSPFNNPAFVTWATFHRPVRITQWPSRDGSLPWRGER